MSLLQPNKQQHCVFNKLNNENLENFLIICYYNVDTDLAHIQGTNP